MEKIIYSKFSNERKRMFCTATIIMEGIEGIRKVVKRALTEESKKHLDEILLNRKYLLEYYKTHNIALCSCNKVSDIDIEFEYVNGISLDNIINKHIDSKNYDLLYEDIILLRNIITDVNYKNKFKVSDEFVKVFGNVKLSEDLIATDYSNIDLVTSNIIINDEIINIIDYEWVFLFPIPLNYIMFRSIFLHGQINLLPEDIKNKIYSIAGISNEEIELYIIMENNLQQYISGNDNKLEYLYNKIGTKNYPINLVNTYDINFLCKLTAKYDNKEIYNEKKIFTENYVNFTINIYKEFNELILEPIDSNCIMKLISVKGQGDAEDEWTELELNEHNSDLCIYNDFYFKHDKPKFVFINKGYKCFNIVFQIFKRNDILIHQVIDYIYENAYLKNKLNFSDELNRNSVNQINELTDNYNKLEKNNVDLKSELDKCKELNNDLKKKLCEVKDNLSSLSDEHILILEKYENEKKINLELEKNIFSLEKNLEDMVKKNNDLINQVSDLNSKLAQINDSIFGKLYNKFNGD